MSTVLLRLTNAFYVLSLFLLTGVLCFIESLSTFTTWDNLALVFWMRDVRRWLRSSTKNGVVVLVVQDIQSGPTDSISQKEEDHVVAHLPVIDEKSQFLLSFNTSADSSPSLPAKADQLLQLKPTVEILKATVKDLKSPDEFISDMYGST